MGGGVEAAWSYSGAALRRRGGGVEAAWGLNAAAWGRRGGGVEERRGGGVGAGVGAIRSGESESRFVQYASILTTLDPTVRTIVVSSTRDTTNAA